MQDISWVAQHFVCCMEDEYSRYSHLQDELYSTLRSIEARIVWLHYPYLYKKNKKIIQMSPIKVGTIYVISHMLEKGHFALARPSKKALYSGNTSLEVAPRRSRMNLCLA